MEKDGRVVEIAKDRNTEAVGQCMRYQESGVDSNRFARGWRIAGANGRRCGDELCTAERDARRHRHLTEQIEPARDPRVESGLVVWGQDGGPEVGASTGRDGGHYLRHTEGDEEGEEADDDPAHGHDAWSACGESILEQSRNPGNDALDDG